MEWIKDCKMERLVKRDLGFWKKKIMEKVDEI